jgi:hypothetical protein
MLKISRAYLTDYRSKLGAIIVPVKGSTRLLPFSLKGNHIRVALWSERLFLLNDLISSGVFDVMPAWINCATRKASSAS